MFAVVSPEIEKLLVIQDRDRRLLQLEQELQRIPVEKQEIESKLKTGATRLEELKLKAKQTESARKSLENDAEAKRTQINKWRSQQVMTKKNEEYQALTHEIQGAEKEIFQIEDKELDLMEQAEKFGAEIKREQQLVAELTALVDRQRQTLGQREAAMKAELTNIKNERNELCKTVDESMLSR